ncbi:hypothetical protein C0995_011439 [Termitomyces sp. Mi166|nr:hypothetical protein C0995_011439 [Termitomyces sp. Mi166\
MSSSLTITSPPSTTSSSTSTTTTPLLVVESSLTRITTLRSTLSSITPNTTILPSTISSITTNTTAPASVEGTPTITTIPSLVTGAPITTTTPLSTGLGTTFNTTIPASSTTSDHQVVSSHAGGSDTISPGGSNTLRGYNDDETQAMITPFLATAPRMRQVHDEATDDTEASSVRKPLLTPNRRHPHNTIPQTYVL